MKSIAMSLCVLGGAGGFSASARASDAEFHNAEIAAQPDDPESASTDSTQPADAAVQAVSATAANSVRRDDPQADRLFEVGSRAFDAGDFAVAAVAWARASDRFAAAGQRDRFCDAATMLAASQSALGRQPAAITSATRAIEVAQQLGDARREALASAARGRARMFSTEADAAEDDLVAAQIQAQRIDDEPLYAQVSNDLGNLYAARGQTVRAIGEYETASSMAQRHDDRLTAATAAANAALASANDADGNTAQRIADARRLVDQLDDGYVKCHLLLNLARADRSMIAAGGDPVASHVTSSYSAAIAARDIAVTINHRLLESHAWAQLGELYASQKRPDDALFATRKAVFLAQQTQSPDAIFAFQWQLGRLLRDAGQLDHAIDAYKRALSVLTQSSLANIRHDLAIGFGNQNSRKTFRQTIGPVFYEAADLLLRKADNLDDPKLQQESLELARGTIEQLKSAELEDYFQDDCVNLVKKKARGIDVGLANTAIVYLIPLADRTEILLSTSGGLKRFRADVSEPALTAEVKELRLRLEDDLDFEYRTHAAKIYDWLIRPIEQSLAAESIDTLVFVPDGELRTIPMGALLDRETKLHLIEKFAVAVSPGLELTEPTPLAERKNVVLLAAGLSESRQNFPALPGVPQELAQISNLYGGVQLKDETFGRSQFADQFRGDSFTIVHIASHGKFSGTARETFVLTYDGRLYLNDLEKLIQPSQFRGEPVELLTLSACQTAAGEDSARAALGLAGVAIKAGARSALASLWSVNDAASSELIGSFYTQLRNNPQQTKSKALQAAQIELLKKDNTRHPRYWAPFLIIGNWM